MFPKEEEGTPEIDDAASTEQTGTAEVDDADAASGAEGGETDIQTSVELDDDDVPATDIAFECPHCSKSLSIDPRGAGLVILCVQCGKPVTVPIPEGLEIDDFDASPEELSVQLLHARQNLAKFQARMSEMEEELDELRTFRENALRINEGRRAVRERVRAQLAIVCKMQEEAQGMVREVIGMAAETESP